MIKFTVENKNDPPTKVLSSITPMPENTKSKIKVANLKILDDDIGQMHTCDGIGSDKDWIETLTENNGNVSVFILGNKKKTNFEDSQSFNSKYFYFDLLSKRYVIKRSIGRLLYTRTDPWSIEHKQK